MRVQKRGVNPFADENGQHFRVLGQPHRDVQQRRPRDLAKPLRKKPFASSSTSTKHIFLLCTEVLLIKIHDLRDAPTSVKQVSSSASRVLKDAARAPRSACLSNRCPPQATRRSWSANPAARRSGRASGTFCNIRPRAARWCRKPNFFSLPPAEPSSSGRKSFPPLRPGELLFRTAFLDSTTVYQGVARKIPAEIVESINRFAAGPRLPDITFLLDMDSAEAHERLIRRPDSGIATAWRNSLLPFMRPFAAAIWNSPPRSRDRIRLWTQPNPKAKSPAKFARPFVPMPFSKESAFERLSESQARGGWRTPIFSPAPPEAESPGWPSILPALVLECPAESALAHPDVHMVQPESKSRRIVIDQIRELEHSIQRKPLLASSKVAIIHDADRMQPQAANAFLKTLEEPPPGSLILLLSTRPKANPGNRSLALPRNPTPGRTKRLPATEELAILEALEECLSDRSNTRRRGGFPLYADAPKYPPRASREDLFRIREHPAQGNCALQAGVATILLARRANCADQGSRRS